MKKFQVGAFYFPNFHPGDPSNEAIHGKGWCEWELIRTAPPRFPGHCQPQRPVWGFEDESDPVVMAKKIDAAADHALDFWLFDWYHYNDGPFLNKCLDEGFLAAPNRDRIKFALMWANHDWYRIHGWNPCCGQEHPELDHPGKVTPETFERICDLVIEKYFRQPNYLTIDGRPFFSIYEIGTFATAYPTDAEMRAALDRFREKVRDAGFPGLHLNIMYWGMPNLPGGRTPDNWAQVIEATGADSCTSYTWVHHRVLQGCFPVGEYSRAREIYLKAWEEARRILPVPYFPNVTMGWDNSPRCAHGVPWVKDMPHVLGPTMVGNTPQEFQKSLEVVKAILEAHPEQPRTILINAWNEWPESSVLEPEERYGYGYLEAIQKVFGQTS